MEEYKLIDQTGYIWELFATREEAIETMQRYKKEDILDGTSDQYTYEIVT